MTPEPSILPQLPLFHTIAGKPVVVIGAGEAAEAKRRLVERAGARVHTEVAAGLAAGARLAFIASDEPAPLAERLRAAGLLVNVVDRPELCDFTTPAVVDRAPVLVAIGTSGASAGLAKALRLRLEALLPARLGDLARGLFAARGALRARYPDATARRQAIDAALAEGGMLDPFDTSAAARIDGWLGGAAGPDETGPYEIHLRSADPDDLTLGEARALGRADLVLHEAGVAAAILARARADAPRRVLTKGGAGEASAGLTVILRAPINNI